MELLIIVAAVCMLGVLALRFGRDSRDTLSSTEEWQARHGMVW
jgi:hypothetical protein